MPYKSISDLPAPVRNALPTAAQEIYLSVFNAVYGPDCDDACAAAQAWGAVKKAYRQTDGGKWTAMENATQFRGNTTPITGSHDVVLQRLDTLIKNNSRMIRYAADAFANVEAWTGTPVIYAQPTEGGILRHPNAADVTAGTLGANYRIVGRIAAANIDTGGEPILRAVMEIDDPEIDERAAGGKLSLSTGFSGQIANIRDQETLVGRITPNHVLIFDRGACPNCYPNDNGARFENVCKSDHSMTDETAPTAEAENRLFRRLSEILDNLKAPEQPAEQTTPTATDAANVAESADGVTDMATEEEIKNITAERDDLKAKLEALENAARIERADRVWAELKNSLPVGWLGEKEAATRAEFEADPAAFAVKAIKFNAENAQTPKTAEGTQTAPVDMTAENAAEAEIAEFEKAYGIKFIE